MIAINGFNICLLTSSFLFLWDSLVGETDIYQIVTQIHILVGFTECHEGEARCFLRGSCLPLVFREGFSEDGARGLSAARAQHSFHMEETAELKVWWWESMWFF